MYTHSYSVNAYTYSVMALSVAGGIIARKYGFVRNVFLVPFLAAPFFAFYQKKEADYNMTSDYSKYIYRQVDATPQSLSKDSQFWTKHSNK